MITRPLTSGSRFLPPLVAALALVSPALAGAQESDEVRNRNCVCTSDFTTQIERFFPSGARLGIALGDARTMGARTGVAVNDVEEDGPAERAGIQDGDVLFALNGTELGDEPADRLRELMGDVQPGDTVRVAYHRDGRDQTAQVVAERRDEFMVRAMPRGQMRFPPGAFGQVRVGPGEVLWRHGSHGLELVEMNEGLSSYFNVGEGVLVASVPEDSPLGLQPGDVVLTIGGREVEDAAHMRSILASYREDEEVAFDLVRAQRRMTVTGRAR